MTTQPTPAASSYDGVTDPPDDVGDLGAALRQLAAYATSQGTQYATLGALLVRGDQLPSRMNDLVGRVMKARPTSGGWVLADGASSTEAPEPLEDRLVAVLGEVSDPLTDAQILQRLPEAGDLKTIRKALFADERIIMADTGGWTLAGKHAAQELQLFEVPGPGASPVSSRKQHRRSLKERVQMCFREAGHPLSLQALTERLGEDVNEGSLKYLLSTDALFMRSDISEWALSHWGLRRYTSVKELVAEALDEAGGAIALSDLEQKLTSQFTIKLATLRQATSAPPYVTSAGIVRRLGSGQSSLREAELAEPFHDFDDEETGIAEADGPSAEELIDLMGLS